MENNALTVLRKRYLHDIYLFSFLTIYIIAMNIKVYFYLSIILSHWVLQPRHCLNYAVRNNSGLIPAANAAGGNFDAGASGQVIDGRVGRDRLDNFDDSMTFP